MTGLPRKHSSIFAKHFKTCHKGTTTFYGKRLYLLKRNGLHSADRFCYSMKFSSSRMSKSSSKSSNCLGGNLISYCSFASARTSGRLSFVVLQTCLYHILLSKNLPFPSRARGVRLHKQLHKTV